MPLFGSGRNLTPSSFLGGIFITVRCLLNTLEIFFLSPLFQIKDVCIIIFIMLKAHSFVQVKLYLTSYHIYLLSNLSNNTQLSRYYVKKYQDCPFQSNSWILRLFNLYVIIVTLGLPTRFCVVFFNKTYDIIDFIVYHAFWYLCHKVVIYLLS